MNKGKKNDANKPDLSLIPVEAMEEAARAFEVGERKYGRYNYYKGLEASRLVAALMRHVTAWNEGEEYDPTDGQHHLGSVIACAAMILKTRALGTLIDNRYAAEAAPAPQSVDIPEIETFNESHFLEGFVPRTMKK